KTNKPRIEMGKPKATQNASLECKKIDKKMITKKITRHAFFANNLVRCVKVIEESETTYRRILLYFLLKSSMYSFTRFAVGIKSSLFVLLMVIFTARFPLKKDAFEVSAKRSRTMATSRNFTWVPSGKDFTTILSSSSP